MVEGARLESVYTRKGIAGSNPALSANIRTRVPSLWLGIFISRIRGELARPSRRGMKRTHDSASFLVDCLTPPTLGSPERSGGNPALTASLNQCPH